MSDLFTYNSYDYDKGVYERLEESLHEYLDDQDFIDKLIPHLKKVLLKDLEDRKKAYERIEDLVKTLFPEEELEIKKPVVLG